MKISVNCKLDYAGTYGFIKPIADIEAISHIDVFRDSPAQSCVKVKYHLSFNRRNGYLSQFSKLIKMFLILNKNYKFVLGIYEIPHAIMAYIVGRTKNVPIVISIIGNPEDIRLRNYIRRKFTYYIYEKCDILTVTGSKSKNYLQNLGFNPDKIFILPNAIDIEKFVPNESMKKKFDIINLGRLSPEKELINLVKIINLLKNDIPDIKVGIAGKGSEENNIRNSIISLGLENNITLLGYVDNIVDFYNSGKIFILTSRTEGLPRTLIEAMSCGIPCIASNVGNMEDIIDHEENGLLVEENKDYIKYCSFIIRLLNDHTLYDKLSSSAISKVKNYYSYKSATKVWENILAFCK